MSNTREVARLNPDERREQILRVAATHYAREDQDTVSIQAIAEDAGVARALVYHYFPGKDALLNAVLQREAEKLLAATAPIDGLSPRANLERSLGAYLDHFSASTGRLRDFHMPRSTTASLVADLVARNHAVQVVRVLHHLGLDDVPAMRMAIAAWLGFVTEAARQAPIYPSVPRTETIRRCMQALSAVTDRSPKEPSSLRLHQKEAGT
jgi:AcrR family transcriptional regulator